MPEMNDLEKTDLNLTRVNLEGIVYEGDDQLDVKYSLNDVVVETRLTYISSYNARKDYQMLIDMLNTTSAQQELLREDLCNET